MLLGSGTCLEEPNALWLFFVYSREVWKEGNVLTTFIIF